MHALAALAAFATFTTFAVACSSSSSTSSFQRPDAAPHDASSDAACTTDSGPGLVCPALADCPLDAGASLCASDLAAAQAISPCAVAATGNRLGFATCAGGLVAVSVTGIDTGTVSYFDASSGARVAVVGFGNTTSGCAGGPSCFSVPSCAKATLMACDDGGH